MANRIMQVLPIRAGGIFALPMHAVSSIHHLDAPVADGGRLSSDVGMVFDLHQIMWGKPSAESRHFVVVIHELDLTFGLLVDRVLTARPLEQLHPLPETFLKAGRLFQGLFPLDNDLVLVLDIENLSTILQRTPWMTHDDRDHSL